MNPKKTTSLIMLWSMMLMSYTGIMLYIAPHGRIAHWIDWSLFGWTKDQFGEVHTTFMVLFLIATIFHIYYNWKLLTNYMKNKVKSFVFFTSDMIIALTITSVFLFGTLYQISPFSTFVNFGENIKESWAKKKDEPPYGHAEESTLEDFCSKMNYDLQKVIKTLEDNKLHSTQEDTIKFIATKYNITTVKLYSIITKPFGAETTNKITGLGRKNFQQISKELNIPLDIFLKKLEKKGIKATKNDKFKSTIEKQGFSSREVIDDFQ